MYALSRSRHCVRRAMQARCVSYALCRALREMSGFRKEVLYRACRSETLLGNKGSVRLYTGYGPKYRRCSGQPPTLSPERLRFQTQPLQRSTQRTPGCTGNGEPRRGPRGLIDHAEARRSSLFLRLLLRVADDGSEDDHEPHGCACLLYTSPSPRD